MGEGHSLKGARGGIRVCGPCTWQRGVRGLGAVGHAPWGEVDVRG